MPNQMILSMDEKYPFGAFQQQQKENRQIIVRKQIKTGNKNQIISQAKFLKKLKPPNSIQIISIFEEINSVQIYYEYVPVKYEAWMKTMSDQLSNNLLKQLFNLANFLADNKIDINFNIQCIGFNEEFHIKYFLDFQILKRTKSLDLQQLKQSYYRQIALIIKNFNNSSQITDNRELFISLKPAPYKRIIDEQEIEKSKKMIARTPSLGVLFPKKRKNININITEASQQNVRQQQKQKQSALSIKINQPIKKLEQIRQRLRLEKLQKPSSFQPLPSYSQLRSQNCLLQISKQPIVDKQYIGKVKSPKRNFTNEQCISPSKFRNTLQVDVKLFQRFNYFEMKKNKSQKFKTPKNSQSPVDFKSTQNYVQDFMNVIQDDQENCIQDQENYTYDQQDKNFHNICRESTQSSQNSNIHHSVKIRFFDAIQNSKRLISKMNFHHKH